ncbi:YoaK family protein [Sphingomonas sp. PB2P19]|uniref:YoaK family protein n=1 Tax=Sphingomonas rhamnosi TaxID=3096156 RepID=UPI002FCBDE82
MRRYQQPHRLLAIGLAILAGFVDALGFLELRGMFVSFMSGNSTRMAVGAATSVHGSLFAGGLIAAFVIGVMAGTGAGAIGGRWRKPAVLALVSVLLTLASLVETVIAQSAAATLLMASAMGAANAVFQRDGEVSVGVTYMTGTLVKIGQHLAVACSGGPRLGWVPYLLLWLGLMVGAVAGATVYPLFGLDALWNAVASAALLTIYAARLGPLPASG